MQIPITEKDRLHQVLLDMNLNRGDYAKRKALIDSPQYAIQHNEHADPLEVARISKWICFHCKELTPPKIFQRRPRGVPGIGFWLRPSTHGCRAEKAHLKIYNQKEKQREQDQSAALWRQKMNTAGLEGRLADCTFNSFVSRKDWPGALKVKADTMKYVDGLLAGELEDSNWLILTGPPGTGKTHLAAAAVREVLSQGRSAVFRNWPVYLTRIQASWDKRQDPHHERESDIVAELEKGWLVVIDDLDKRASSEWVKGMLYTFLNQRYNKRQPTIITLNTPIDQPDPLAPGRLALQEIMGGAVLDRAIEAWWKYIEFNGPSFRSGKKWR